MGQAAAPFRMKVGDRLPAIRRQLTDAYGTPLKPDLSTASSVMFNLRPSGVATKLIGTYAIITNASQCMVEYDWGAGETTPTGLLGASAPMNYYQAEFAVMFPSSLELTVPNQDYIPVVLQQEI